MPIVDNLKDKKGDTIYPRTITEAVADPTTGENLNQMLDGVIRRANDGTEIVEDLEETLENVVVRHEGRITTNEINIGNLTNYIGNLEGLTTVEKDNLVNAINELKNKNDSLQNEVDEHKDINVSQERGRNDEMG